MELKIFQRKNVSFINMLEFLLKALVLFDTNNLYSRRQKLAKVDNNNIFNQCFNTQKGGNQERNEPVSGNKTGTESVSGNKTGTESVSGNGTGTGNKTGTGNETGTGNKTGTGNGNKTGNGTGSGDNESAGSGDNESAGNESGNGSGDNESVGNESDGNGKLLHYKSELITYFNKGTDAVKNKIAYLMSFIAFASIYPALPFFVVLATLYGLLKWLFSKIRML